jgi:hypothetical protein
LFQIAGVDPHADTRVGFKIFSVAYWVKFALGAGGSPPGWRPAAPVSRGHRLGDHRRRRGGVAGGRERREVVAACRAPADDTAPARGRTRGR